VLRLEVPEKALNVLSQPSRYKVLYGGRGSSKSWSVARILLAMGMGRKLRILCARETQKSIADSVHKLLKDQIYELGLDGFYEVLQSSIRGTNGTEFLFSGLRDAASLKSYEGIDICWIEEAQAVTEASWQLLIPTIRAENSEIWVVFNPLHENDPTYIRFVLESPDDCRIAKINYTDNPFFPDVLRLEMESDREKNYARYLHVWEGECMTVPEGAVYDLAWFKRYNSLPKPPDRIMVVHSWDTAFKAGTHNDPSCCLVWHITPNLFYLAEMHHGKWEYPELKKRAIDLANRDNPDVILIEDKASGQSLIQEMKSLTRHPIVAMKPDADKETRARTTAAIVESGKVFLPEYAPWLQKFETEVALFPSESDLIHDDIVDALSQFLRYMRDRGNPKAFEALLDDLGY
jgi:predicted phage terminase large subunit-like protein